ncbi:MAG: BamA/TamA family outer membrane protein [Candidatus Krumholzibacteriia bacterium]
MLRSIRTGVALAVILTAQPLVFSRPLAVAQGTAPRRADLLRDERRAKAAAVREPERATTEKLIIGLNNVVGFAGKLRGGLAGFHFATGDFPSGAGFAYGLGFTDLAVGSLYEDADLSNRLDVDAQVAFSTASYFRGRTEVALRNIRGAPFHVSLMGQYYEYAEEDFFGFGLDATRESDRTSYRLDAWEVGGDFQWEPESWLHFGGGAAFLSPRVRSGEDDLYPSTEEVFAPATLPGFSAEPDFVRIDGWLRVDRRDNPSYTRAGSFAGAKVSVYEDRDLGAFDFRRFEFEAQQYIPWLQEHRVLALRANAVITDTNSGSDVPFYFMPTLGGSSVLRGFRESRFRERNSILFGAEYRWEAWWALDMALFVDSGKVASDKSDLDFDNLQNSWGLGFRFHKFDAFVLRLDLAISREGFIPFLRYKSAF